MNEFTTESGVVAEVSCDAAYRFSKPVQPSIRLLAGLGVEGDAHAGVTVRHRWEMRRTPNKPNLRQVHLIQTELIDRLRADGFRVGPGMMGENITTRGIDLPALPRGTRLRLGDAALVELTGLRSPCHQLNDLQPGLMKAVMGEDATGQPISKLGAMAIVIEGGEVCAGDPIEVILPAGPYVALEYV